MCEILDLILSTGAHMAEPGEFTKDRKSVV